MLSKGFRILWLKLRTEENKHFYLSFPVPLYIFQELLDCTLDLLKLACLFARNRSNPDSSLSLTVYTVKEFVQITMKLLDSLTEDGPYNLVDVTAHKVKISVGIR